MNNVFDITEETLSVVREIRKSEWNIQRIRKDCPNERNVRDRRRFASNFGLCDQRDLPDEHYPRDLFDGS